MSTLFIEHIDGKCYCVKLKDKWYIKNREKIIKHTLTPNWNELIKYFKEIWTILQIHNYKRITEIYDVIGRFDHKLALLLNLTC